MKKKIYITTIIVGLSLGLFSFILAPLTNPKSSLYSPTFGRIATELVFTPEAAYAFCPMAVCGPGPSCVLSNTDTFCTMEGNDCITLFCVPEP